MSMIDCSTCGSYKIHAAHGQCRRCYSKDKYKRDRKKILAKKKADEAIKQDLRQDKICRRLHAILTPMIPEGANSKHISWDQATGLYNHQQHKKEHFLALCRAVQFQGEEWGLIAHKRPVGGVEIQRL